MVITVDDEWNDVDLDLDELPVGAHPSGQPVRASLLNASRTIAWPSSAYSDELMTSESIVRPIASWAEYPNRCSAAGSSRTRPRRDPS